MTEDYPTKVIKSQQLSKPYDPRYVIIDTKTNEVIDDAKGYGYTSFGKAVGAFHYKKKTNKRP